MNQTDEFSFFRICTSHLSRRYELELGRAKNDQPSIDTFKYTEWYTTEDPTGVPDLAPDVRTASDGENLRFFILLHLEFTIRHNVSMKIHDS